MSISKFIARRLNRKNNLRVVSCHENLHAVSRGTKTNASHRSRSIQPVFDSCEERIVPALMGAVAGGLVSESLGIVTEQLLEQFTGLGNQSEFKEINRKLDALDNKVTALQNTVARIEGKLDQVIFKQLDDDLKIGLINTYWD
ncbi:MAG: hypothetical protein ACKO5E_16045, partial [bacterium]